MPEQLTEYRNRTGFMWDSLPHDGGFCTNESLRKKISDAGEMLPFYGDTVIFMLEPATVAWLSRVQELLYASCGAYLAERLVPETFHITLHDLKSSAGCMPTGTAENKSRAIAIIDHAGKTYREGISLVSNCMFSMVGTSIVMGFEPKSEADCQILMQLYEELQSVVPLGYPLTLHATLAYYKPGSYDDGALHALRAAMETIGRERTECRLDMNRLHYATFETMNRYWI